MESARALADAVPPHVSLRVRTDPPPRGDQVEMLSRLKFSDQRTVPSAATPTELTPLAEGVEMCTVPTLPISRPVSNIASLTCARMQRLVKNARSASGQKVGGVGWASINARSGENSGGVGVGASIGVGVPTRRGIATSCRSPRRRCPLRRQSPGLSVQRRREMPRVRRPPGRPR